MSDYSMWYKVPGLDTPLIFGYIILPDDHPFLDIPVDTINRALKPKGVLCNQKIKVHNFIRKEVDPTIIGDCPTEIYNKSIITFLNKTHDDSIDAVMTSNGTYVKYLNMFEMGIQMNQILTKVKNYGNA